MTTPYPESSQVLDTFGISYEELLFYEQHHLFGKRVRLLWPIASLSEILNLYGSFCSEQLPRLSMVRHHSFPFSSHLFSERLHRDI